MSRIDGLVWLLLTARVVWAWAHVNQATLETGLVENGLTLVAFVAPSEPKSHALEQEWLIASFEAQTGTLLSIDCEAELTLCTSHKISSFPSIKLFKNGVPGAKYLGPRRATAIVNFVSRMSRPAVSELDQESLEAFQATDDVVFISYINAEDVAARQSLYAVAEKFREEFTFGLVSDDAAIKAEKIETSTMVCHVTEDRRTKSFTSFTEPESLAEFVSEASRRIIGELTRQTQQRLLDRGWPMVYVFGETEAERTKLRQSLRDFAKSYDSLTVVTVDHLEFPDLQKSLGLEPGVFPAGAVHQLSKDRIYPYPRGLAIDSRSLQKWGLDVWQGRIKPWMPPGATAAFEDAGLTKAATRKISIADIPGVTIRVAGRDEL